ncbi:MAG: nicotinate-nucleotide diphosphorylase (carboxylating) [Verrucomicrobia bacterium Tous-C9LFEB]|nr:MAG: nicotinate-nucleotide diphosphorylase (carboxylating) [Verrucomicrobia bacterium Tous-C9LFEB]
MPAPTPPSSAVIREAAARALGEDRGPADITSLAAVPAEAQSTARIVTRQACVLAGLPVAQAIFLEEDASLKITMRAQDGDTLKPGDVALEVSGSARSLLTAERTALNFLQQLSAVATRTRQFVDAVTGTKAKILDTRKTIPGLRALQKYAVLCGGGQNHRMGLYDMFLLKDNHLALMGAPGNWGKAIAAARALEPSAKVEVEADTLDQVRAIAPLGVDIILLDNMSLDEMRAAVEIIAGRALSEASGNMNLERVRAVAETGVDFISVGALTHTITSIDLSLEIV